MFNVRPSRAEKFRLLLVSIFYMAYTVAMVYCIIHAANQNDVILYSVLLLFMPFGMLYEFVQYCYSKAYHAFYERCDTELAEKYLKFAEKFNFFKKYRAFIVYLKSFILLDNDKPKDAREYINTKIGSLTPSNISMNFQYNYLFFSCCAVMEDKSNIGQYFTALKRIIGMKERPGSDLISLGNFIYGIYCMVSKKYSEAADAFQKVKPENLSPREKARYYFYAAELCAKYSDKDRMEENYKKAIEFAPKMKLIINHKPEI